MTTEPLYAHEVNCTTGEVTVRELTAEEIVVVKADQAKAHAEWVAEQDKIAAFTALKESAKAKLVAGEPLTEEEAATLVI
jgi:hypothetical protein